MPVLPSLEAATQRVERDSDILSAEQLLSDRPGTIMLLGSTAMTMATNSERYADHNRRMFEIADAYGLGTEGMSACIGLHDLVEGLFSDDDEVRTSTQTFVEEYNNQLGTDSERRLFTTYVGYAIGGWRLEAEIAEAWREPTLNIVDDLPDVSDPDKILIKQAITKDIPPDTDTTYLESLLKNTRLMDLDIELLSSIIDRHDVESVLSKTIELIDNIDSANRPANNPASTWRDAIEALTCWGPMCDLYGYFALGAQLRGKAYEFFYEDNEVVAEKARNQHRLSQKYLPLVSVVAKAGLHEAYDGLGEAPVQIRTKTLGSLEQKFSESSEYDEVEMLPDGIGVRVIVPDTEFVSSTIAPLADRTVDYLTSLAAEHFGEDITDFSIRLWHPNGIEDAREDRVENGGKDAYHAYHLTFMMQVNGEQVPIEVQYFGESQDANYIWGPQSHPVYKLNRYGKKIPKRVKRMEQEQLNRHLQSFRSRAEYLKRNPESASLNPNAWFDILQLCPGMDTPLHEVFGVNEAGVMVPRELIGTRAAEAAIDGESKVILPPTELTRRQFHFLTNLLDPTLSSNTRVLKALDIVRERHAGLKRNNSTTGDAEGHILPAAAYAAIVASISGQRWQEHDSVDLEELLVVGLLHDTLEDTFGNTSRERGEGIAYLNQEFGPTTTESVRALTLPPKVRNETVAGEKLRRDLYILQVQGDNVATHIKPADRLQNHTRDVAELMQQDRAFDEQSLRWIEEYQTKTNDHMLGLIEDMPHEYYDTSIQVIWKMLTESLQLRRAGQKLN